MVCAILLRNLHIKFSYLVLHSSGVHETYGGKILAKISFQTWQLFVTCLHSVCELMPEACQAGSNSTHLLVMQVVYCEECRSHCGDEGRADCRGGQPLSAHEEARHLFQPCQEADWRWHPGNHRRGPSKGVHYSFALIRVFWSLLVCHGRSLELCCK